ncbi:DUF4290 domain-containing protein [Lutimonas saemankumensis]|uniref:DUF4290 domain-containing protein n=1 Tax=Lutimonas saemankumensis TaxID=483016 RepID=UPI001CD46D9A|nr:DUF4290 domain-containing protein [Lutimonas saemankumensis]MCA0932155.1 DUF4290 domain-containing protein [Lutimonas saemankumensis]
MELEYNSDREHLIIPEYGRHIQKLVNHCVKLEDREVRNTMAKAIVQVMGNMQPHLRDVPDFQHKLWDQLFIMSDYELDVDTPYPKPEREVLQAKPQALDYPRSASKYRFYGNNIQIMIDTALTWEDGDLKDALVFTIANHMKKCYLNWNKDTVDDEVIFSHLKELSGGRLVVKDTDSLSESKDLVRKKPSKGFQKSSSKQGKKNFRKR